MVHSYPLQVSKKLRPWTWTGWKKVTAHTRKKKKKNPISSCVYGILDKFWKSVFLQKAQEESRLTNHEIYFLLFGRCCVFSTSATLKRMIYVYTWALQCISNTGVNFGKYTHAQIKVRCKSTFIFENVSQTVSLPYLINKIRIHTIKAAQTRKNCFHRLLVPWLCTK